MADADTGKGAGDDGGLNAAGKNADQNFGSVPVGSETQTCGSTPPSSVVVSPYKKSWIQIKLVDQDGNPVAGEEFSIQLPDGSPVDGYLDGNGFFQITGIDPGTCQVTFPNLDAPDWDHV